MLPYLKWYPCKLVRGISPGKSLPRQVLRAVLSLWLAMALIFIDICPGAAELNSEVASLKQVRYWSDSGYTRVVLDLDKKVDYKVHRLKADQEAKKTARIFLDLSNTKCGENLSRQQDLDQGPVQAIRAAPFNTQTSRLVLDLRELDHYKVFALEEPPRIVIDLWQDKEIKGPSIAASEKKLPAVSSAVSAARKRDLLPLVVLDPGHGGKDPGAISKKGLKEKNIVFSITKYVQAILEKDAVAKVVLTREKDIFLPLETRTQLANAKGADLFVSIHANAYPTPDVRGIETFYLDNTTDKAAMRLAAIENATANVKMGNLQGILLTLRQNANALESYNLAHTVQTSLVGKLAQTGYRDVPSLGAKGNLFYVLVGARMPSILVEVSFITNAIDERRLKTQKYQHAVAQGIAAGIKKYFKQGGLKNLLVRQ